MGKYFTCEEVAKRYEVEVDTVRKWIRNKRIDAIRIGKGYRITEEALEAFDKASHTINR